ncbi:hypothetical protein H6P81_018777 [Aristolochia fimbriata]|uniref:Uncharacterized protein n=1 Tax=Aristolochia fimbriata TaxID=158543 RepID=A0AAV7E6D1_ARIFI|nr:hypothetical protein H6P81_018777 [Aristolochia fimbriata]
MASRKSITVIEISSSSSSSDEDAEGRQLTGKAGKKRPLEKEKISTGAAEKKKKTTGRPILKEEKITGAVNEAATEDSDCIILDTNPFEDTTKKLPVLSEPKGEKEDEDLGFNMADHDEVLSFIPLPSSSSSSTTRDDLGNLMADHHDEVLSFIPLPLSSSRGTIGDDLGNLMADHHDEVLSFIPLPSSSSRSTIGDDLGNLMDGAANEAFSFIPLLFSSGSSNGDFILTGLRQTHHENAFDEDEAESDHESLSTGKAETQCSTTGNYY